MKRKVAVFTGTRAEYGLLYWLLNDIRSSDGLELQLIVGGAHLSPEFGETWREIVADGFSIDARIEMLLSSDTAVGVAKSMGLGTIGAADALDRLKPDFLVVLGDRFEALAVVQAALVMRVPVAHLHGGESSEGAYDDAIRHAITKMSSMHFTATETYRNRVMQMGEHPDDVFNVGALGLDHLSRSQPRDPRTVAGELGFAVDRPYFLLTYHPVTVGDEPPGETIREIFAAVDRWPGHQVIITFPNADNGGRVIISEIEKYASSAKGRVFALPSLGTGRYLSLLRHSVAVVGNSSSGIIEAPSLGVPTVDVGVRQRGRLAAESVIHCDPVESSIMQAIGRAMSDEFRALARNVVNPYGSGSAAGRIVEVLAARSPRKEKRFRDLECKP